MSWYTFEKFLFLRCFTLVLFEQASQNFCVNMIDFIRFQFLDSCFNLFERRQDNFLNRMKIPSKHSRWIHCKCECHDLPTFRQSALILNKEVYSFEGFGHFQNSYGQHLGFDIVGSDGHDCQGTTGRTFMDCPILVPQWLVEYNCHKIFAKKCVRW